ILNGQAKCSDDIFAKIFEKTRDKHFEEMERSLRAVICLFDCYEGRTDKIEEWLEKNAPNENLEIFTMDIYSYFVKMRCYLQTGRYMMTSLLAKRFIEILRQSYRPHDLCECYLLSAMACYKAGDKKSALIDFEKSLEIGIPLGYRRLYSDEGQMMLNLIQLYRESKKKGVEGNFTIDEKELRKIKAAALEIARRFPSYLEAVQDMYDDLTKTEKAVLVLLSEGLSNDDIAVRLNKKSGSIKFHTSGIYKKLKVENRQQAINVARSLGIV
ncbi:MAG: LuxR C-terminal-related transcriptional regulator, partial [Bacillota bacterium]|nr:LuxR C-terminal-related transcriptional regulator [Bacillota bacterium]